MDSKNSTRSSSRRAAISSAVEGDTLFLCGVVLGADSCASTDSAPARLHSSCRTNGGNAPMQKGRPSRDVLEVRRLALVGQRGQWDLADGNHGCELII